MARNNAALPLMVPPQSIEAEQAVLGALMLDPASIDLVQDVLNDGDFYRQDHRYIWHGILALSERGMPHDAITLGEWFQAQNLEQLIGSPHYLLELANNTPSAANARAYAEIVREKSILRQLLDVTTKVQSTCFNPQGRPSTEVLDEAEQAVFKIAEAGARGRQGFVSMQASVTDAFKYIVDRHENKGTLQGASTGFKDLDALTSGLQPQDLIIVAARPSMGKTAFAVQIAEAVAVQNEAKKAVLIFSMEMSAAQLTLRQISSIGRIDSQRIKNGALEEEDWPRLTSAITQLQNAHIYIDQTGAISPAELRSKARTKARELLRQGVDVGLIVIDYMQLMKVPGSSENRATELSEISRSLKALAKELDVPVIALSQLNRSLEQRADKRPMMSDLRESGAIEQDADVIMFIYRDEYYNKESPDKGVAEIIIGKQRNGPTNTVRLAFRAPFTRFENLMPDYYTDYN